MSDLAKARAELLMSINRAFIDKDARVARAFVWWLESLIRDTAKELALRGPAESTPGVKWED